MIDPRVIKSLMAECKRSSIPPGLYAHTGSGMGHLPEGWQMESTTHEAVNAEYDLIEKMHHVNR